MTALAILQHVFVWLPLVLGGILLMHAGLRGRRINDHPICRRCRFDLVGLASLSAAATQDSDLESGATKDQLTTRTLSHPDRCPECGTDLTGTTRRARRAVIDGERKKRWRLFALGLVLLLSGLTTGFWLSYKPLAKFPWTTWMPDWVLAEMVDSPSQQRPGPVIKELLGRLNNRNLSTRAIRRVVQQILVVQADESRPWDDTLGHFVQRARALEALSDDHWRQYVTQSVRPVLLVRPGEGGDLFLEVLVTQRACMRAGGGYEGSIAVPFCGITQLDIPITDRVELGVPSDLRAGIVSINGNRPFTMYSRKVTDHLSAGSHTVRNKFLLQFGDDPPGGKTGGFSGLGYASHESYSPSMGSVEVMLETTLIVPEGSPISIPVTGDQTQPPIRQASLRVIQSGDENAPTYEIVLDVLMNDITTEGSVQISVRIEDQGIREEELMKLSHAPDSSGKAQSLRLPIVRSAFHPLRPCATRLWNAKPDAVKLILNPIKNTGLRIADIPFVEVMTERMVLDNVPVKYEQR